VSALVTAQFPDLAGQPISRLGAGWDHELFCAGRQWIFRFPRRAERVSWLLREIEITAICAETLPATIPVFEKMGEPSGAFPYPFVGYRKVPGVGADHSRGRDPAGLAADIGRLFSTLHSISPSRIPPTPDGWEHEPWGELRTGLAAVADLARQLLRPDLNGLIDFSDAMTGDPVLDFTGLIGLGGYAFIDQVAASYQLRLGSGFDARLRWLTKVLTLTWLADSAASDPASITKHLSWIAQAFTR